MRRVGWRLIERIKESWVLEKISIAEEVEFISCCFWISSSSSAPIEKGALSGKRFGYSVGVQLSSC